MVDMKNGRLGGDWSSHEVNETLGYGLWKNILGVGRRFSRLVGYDF